MKPNFKDINIKAAEKASMTAEEWEKANHITKNWTTPELIPVKPVYTAEDLKGMEHLDYGNPMLSIAATWQQGRKVCLLLLTWLPTAGMTQTTHV